MTGTGRPNVSAVLADWCANLQAGDLPDAVIAKAEDCILDAIASAIPGRETPGARRIYEIAASTYRQGRAGIWFADGTLHPAGAAFANAASASMLDIDDGHRAALGHPGAAVVPAALAVAAETDASGEDILVAVVAGYEACVRIGKSEKRKAYHTGNWSGFGAGVAAGRLLGLDASQLAHALAITAYHGPRVADLTLSTDMGSNVKESIPWSVVAGMTAAELAQKGFTGCRDALDIDERFEPGVALDGLGDGFMITRTYFKRYSACRWIHSSVEALLAILAEHDVAPGEIDHVRVETFLQAASLNNHADPHSLESAQYSIPYCLGLAAVLGEASLMPMSKEHLRHPQAADLARKVEVHRIERFDKDFPQTVPAHVTVTTARGAFDTLVTTPWGEPDRAPARAEMLAKLQALADGRISPDRATAIGDAVEGLHANGPDVLLEALNVSSGHTEFSQTAVSAGSI